VTYHFKIPAERLHNCIEFRRSGTENYSRVDQTRTGESGVDSDEGKYGTGNHWKLSRRVNCVIFSDHLQKWHDKHTGTA